MDADNSIPKVIPQEGGQKSAADKKTSKKRASNPKKKFIPANINKGTKPEPSLTATGIWILFIETFAFVYWQLADSFHGYLCGIVHSMSLGLVVAGPTTAVNQALKRPRLIWSLYACVCAGITVVEIVANRPSSPDAATANKFPKMDERQPAALAALADKLQFTADKLSQVTSQRDAANAALIAAQSATEPRKITPAQRNKFIALLSEAHASKISIKVIVGNKDSETEKFAEQFREMLTAAGYGKDAPQSLPPQKVSLIYVTNTITATIPPIGEYSNQDIINLPGLYPMSPSGNWGQKNVEVIAVFSDTNAIVPSLLPAFMAMKATKQNPNGGEVFAYHPTDDPNSIIMGICNALVENGISIGLMPGKGILTDGGVAFFIPQKFY